MQLLADIDGCLCESFGVWQEVEKDGIIKFKIIRSTFIIDKQGKLRQAMYNVNPEGHAQEVLEKIKEITSESE